MITPTKSEFGDLTIEEIACNDIAHDISATHSCNSAV